MTVSYTHLDVYKRQGQDRGKTGSEEAAGACEESCPNTWPLPVSYTHLDVYKRQDILHLFSLAVQSFQN